MNKIIILLLSAILFSVIFFYFIKPNFHTVIPGKFYRSAQLDAKTLTRYGTEYNVSTVLNLRGENPEDEWYIQEKQAALALKANHVDIKLGSTGLPKIHSVKKLIDILQSQTKPLLFHCLGGADRAGLTSVIVLLLEGKQTISEIEKQVSWFYLVFKKSSVGKLFLMEYKRWLNENNIEHTPAFFLKWVDNGYFDNHGNMFFKIDTINSVMFADKEENKLLIVKLDRETTKAIKISGWTINYLKQTLPKEVKILLNRKPIKNMKSGVIRPGVSEAYGHPVFAHSGWVAEQNINELKDGCYNLRLMFRLMDNRTWVSPTKASICINT